MRNNKVLAYDDRESLPNIASLRFNASEEQASFSSRNETGNDEKVSSIFIQDNNGGGAGNENDEEEESRVSMRPLYSIKCVLIVIMVSLVIVTSLLLTTIWISCFSSSVAKFSEDVLREQIEKVVNFTDETIDKVLVVSDTAKNIMWEDFNYTDTENVYSLTYRIYKSSYHYISTLMVTVYFGDTLGGNLGVLVLGGKPTQMLINGTGQYYWYCDDFLNQSYCKYKKKNIPDVVLGPFDMSKIMGVAGNSPNRPMFSRSYTDPTLPSITFMSCVNSHPDPMNQNSTFPYDWYFGIDISVSSISSYIESVTGVIGDSVAFAIEIETNYIVVSSFPEIPVSKFNQDKTETRMTALTFEQPKIRSVAQVIYSSMNNDLKSLKCGEYQFFTDDNSVICMNRFCKAGVDWLLVLNVPKWDYVGQLFIALIVGILSSFIISIVGAVLGVVSSISLFRPFQQLVTVFESISNMRLEDIHMKPSPLAEVNSLQKHFQTMLTRLKNYRAFLPPHILQKLDMEINLRKSSTGRIILERQHSLTSTSGSVNGQMSVITRELIPFAPKLERLFCLGLEKRKITSGMIYFEGLDHFLSALDFDETVSVLNDCFVIIQKTAQATNGQIGGFENNYITITWNSIIESSSHEESATFSVYQILRRLKSTRDKKWKNSQIHNLNFNFRGSLLSQPCVCGNVGTSQIKNYAIFGSYLHNLQLLIKHACKLEISLIVSESIYEKNKESYNFRFVGEKKLLADDESNSPIISPKQDRASFPTRLYQAGETTSMEDAEDFRQSKSVVKDYWEYHNQACARYFDGDLDEAIDLFQMHLSSYQEKCYEEDKAALYLLHKCLDLNKVLN